MKKIFLVLVLAVLISGCTNFPNPFAPAAPQVKEMPPDVMVIQGIDVLPRTTVKPDDQFSVYFEVKNQDEEKLVSGVTHYLYDTGLCTLESFPACPSGVTSATGCNPTYADTPLGDFSPTETKMIEWTFKAPPQNRIAGLSVKCPINFKITYDYNAVSQVDVLVMNGNRLTELQRSGQEVAYTPSLNVGRGPLKIYFDFGSSLPVKVDSTLPVYLVVKDIGLGSYEDIPMSALTIKAPGFQKLSCLENDYFTCTADSGTTCINDKKAIPLIKKQTFQMRCEATTPTAATVPMEKTYFLSADFDYDYDVYGQTTIEVEP